MQGHELVFSHKRSFRLLRHSLFWIAWWLYFSVCYHLYSQPIPGGQQSKYVVLGSHLLVKTFLLVFIYVVACYTFVYFLLPLLTKGKRWKVFAGLLLLCTVLFAAGYLAYWTAFPLVDSLFGPYKPNHFPTRFWPAVSLGLIDPLKVVASAAIIKAVKQWWAKQKESERLEREKVAAELQLLKAQIHPNFLFTSLNNIYNYSLTASPRAPEMLLKLSDLLSYMLYECNGPLVPLDKEIEMIQDYMALEKMKSGTVVETELNAKGDTWDKMIAPFLLLPFLENSFAYSKAATEQAWINLDLNIEKDVFVMKLANGVGVEGSAADESLEHDLCNVKKRLSYIYPHAHELKITREREMLFVLLKIRLAETSVCTPGENDVRFDANESEFQPNVYAAQP